MANSEDAVVLVTINDNNPNSSKEEQEQDGEDNLDLKDIQLYAVGTVHTIILVVPTAFSVACTVVIFFAWIFSLIDLADVWWCLVLGIAAILGTTTGVTMTFYYGPTGKQLERFKQENQRLQKNTDNIKKQVDEFEEENKQLKSSVCTLGDTADRLKQTSDGLAQQLQQFDSLQSEMKSAAAQLGLNVDTLLNETTSVFKDITALNLRNERILLRRIIGDLEFLDRDMGMSKVEFDRFVLRVPQKYQPFLKSAKFEDFAGYDGKLDPTEIRNMIDQMMNYLETQQSEIVS